MCTLCMGEELGSILSMDRTEPGLSPLVMTQMPHSKQSNKQTKRVENKGYHKEISKIAAYISTVIVKPTTAH